MSKYGTRNPDWSLLPEAEPADTPEPSTPPAQQPGDSRAAAGGHLGTLPSVEKLSQEIDAAWRRLAVAFTKAAGSIAAAVDAYDRPVEQALVDLAEREAAIVPEPAVVRLAPGVHWLGEVVAPDRQPFGGRCHHCDEVTSGPDLGEGCPHCGACGAEFTDGGGRGRHCGRNAGHGGRHALAEPGLHVDPAWAGSCLCEDKEAHDADCRQGHGPECGVGCWSPKGCPLRYRRAKPAPEPAGDGPGWSRESITEIGQVVHGVGVNLAPEKAAQVRALLADRDQLATALDVRSGQLHDVLMSEARLLGERDAARRIVAQTNADLDAARAELATARRDAAADALAWAASRLDPDADLVVNDTLDRWAAEVRTGARPAPGSPQPGMDGGRARKAAEQSRMMRQFMGKLDG